MKYENENDVKQALGIESWRNLSKDKMIKFAMMTRDMDSELAARIVEQFPVYAEFGESALGALRKMQKHTLRANKESQDRFYRNCESTVSNFNAQISKGKLSAEELKLFIESIQTILRMMDDKDTENKQFLNGVLGRILLGVGGVLALGGALVGARVVVEAKDNPQGGDSFDSSGASRGT